MSMREQIKQKQEQRPVGHACVTMHIWHLSLASHALCFSRNWNGAMDPVPFVPAMKLCLGGVSTVEAEEAELATKTPLGWDCRRRARVGRAGVLKLNGELER